MSEANNMSKYKMARAIIKIVTLNMIEMSKGDKRIVIVCIIIALLCAFLGAHIKRYDANSWYTDASVIMLQSIAVAALFSIADKVSTFLPIERRLNDINLSILTASEEARISQFNNNKALIASIDRLADYSSYQKSKSDFGFTSLEGIEFIDDADGTVSSQSKHLALNIIRKSEAGSSVCYMTTFLGEESVYIRGIRDAVNRGVKIKLLLMMPSLYAPVIQSRFYDISDINQRTSASDIVARNAHIERFVSLLQAKADIILTVRDELHIVPSPNHGSFEVAFYTKSLNFPMIHLERATKNGSAEVVAYTGFYGGNNAEEMPYVQWRGGEFQICEKFKTLFDEKWYACYRDHKDYKLYEAKERAAAEKSTMQLTFGVI